MRREWLRRRRARREGAICFAFFEFNCFVLHVLANRGGEEDEDSGTGSEPASPSSPTVLPEGSEAKPNSRQCVEVPSMLFCSIISISVQQRSTREMHAPQTGPCQPFFDDGSPLPSDISDLRATLQASSLQALSMFLGVCRSQAMAVPHTSS